MMKDDDDSTFQSLSGATEKLLSKIEEFKETGGEAHNANNHKESGGEEKKAKRAEGDQRRYVEQRLRETAAFELRASGKRFKW